MKDHQVIIRSNFGLDQCIYNAPSSSQVAVIWLQNDQTGECIKRDIIVCSHSRFCHKVQHYNRAFTAVELKSYNAILAPLIYQKHLAAVVVKQKFFADLLQCTSIYRCAL